MRVALFSRVGHSGQSLPGAFLFSLGLAALTAGCSPRVSVPPSKLPELSAAISRSPTEGVRVDTPRGQERLAGGLSTLEVKQDVGGSEPRTLMLSGPIWVSRVGDELVLTYRHGPGDLQGVVDVGEDYKQTRLRLASLRSARVTAYGDPNDRRFFGAVLLTLGTASLAAGGVVVGMALSAGSQREGGAVSGPLALLSLPAFVFGLSTFIPGIYLIATSGAPERPHWLTYDAARATPVHVQGLDAPVVSRAGFVF